MKSASIMGVGSSKRVSAVRWGVAGNIVLAWLFTVGTFASPDNYDESAIDVVTLSSVLTGTDTIFANLTFMGRIIH
jgi:hypothetical protein